MTAELPQLPPRPADGHKGTFGTVCVIGGQAAPPRVMLGGPAFSAEAALRVGAGLAVLGVPAPLMNEALVVAPSATGLALPVGSDSQLLPSEVAELIDQYRHQWSCIAIGPGFGADEPQQQIIMRLVAQDELPLIIDADALNALAAVRQFNADWHCHAILTPHPGEYRKLASSLGIVADPVSHSARPDAARQLAQQLGCVVVLKGAQTIITDGIEAIVNTTGNPSLATAGTGDVLTGMIAGLVAQFFKSHLGVGDRQISPQKQGGLSLLQCAHLGVHLHGLAGDMWAQRHGTSGLVARDLMEELPSAVQMVRDRTS